LPSSVGRSLIFGEGHGKVIENTFPEQSILDLREVLGIVPLAGAKALRDNEGFLTSAPRSLIFSSTTVLQK
jgi:hypothetical protein